MEVTVMINLRPAYSNELYHYGIKGQKWGIRRGPPYPLGKNGHIGSIHNAIWMNKSQDEGYRIYFDPDTQELMYGDSWHDKHGFAPARKVHKHNNVRKAAKQNQKRLSKAYKAGGRRAVEFEMDRMHDEERQYFKNWELGLRKKAAKKTIKAYRKSAKALTKQYGHPVYAIMDKNKYVYRYAHAARGGIPKLKPGEVIL